MACHQEPMATRSTALLQQIEGSVLGGYRSCLFSGHDTPPAQLTLLLPSVYHFHSLFATLEKNEISSFRYRPQVTRKSKQAKFRSAMANSWKKIFPVFKII